MQTLIAKQWHFAYSTPSKTRAFRSAIDLENPSELDDEIEAPNAPKQMRPRRSRLPEKKLADISVALFASPDGRALAKKSTIYGNRDMNERGFEGFCK